MKKPILIHTNIHHRRTGITRSIENVFPFFQESFDAFIYGSNIEGKKISFKAICKLVFNKTYFTFHCHRNNEIILALFLRFLGGNFKLIASRHSATLPSNHTLLLLKKCDVVVTLTEEVSEQIPFPTKIIGHGVNTTVFKPKNETKIEGVKQKNVITCAGRVRKAKGQFMLLKVIAPLLKKHSSWALVIVGKVDNPVFFLKLKDVVKDNQVQNQVYFLEETPNISAIYQASNTVVVPSFSEGFSLVTAEAMASACNTIATKNVGIHSKIIKSGENGYLFDPGNHQQLEKLVLNLMSGEMKLLGAPARAEVIKNWDASLEAKRLMEIYK